MKHFALSCLLIASHFISLAQSGPDDFSHKNHILKFNLTSPFLKNYAAQYEYVAGKRVSVALSGRWMPVSTIPFKNSLRKEVIKNDEESITDAFDQARFSNFAITPEVRFYLGKKGYGRGFYIAPYYRFARYKIQELNYTYEDVEEDININLNGNLTTHTGGFLLGAQWMLGKTIGLDWWILGPNVGSGKGLMTGVSSKPLDADMQQDIRTTLEEDLDIPFTKTTVDVDANGARLKLNGPWAGVRAGLMLTFRF